MTFTQFLDDFVRMIAKNIHLGFIAEIKNFDAQKMRADIQPLLKTSNLDGTVQDYPVIPSVNVQMIYAGGFYIRPSYQSGDKVWCTFSTYDLGNMLNGTASLESETVFALDSCSVVNGIIPNNFQAPNEFSSESGLIMGSTSGNAYIVFKDSEIDFVLGGGSEKIQFTSTGIQTLQQIQAGGEIKANTQTVPVALSTHLHTAGTLTSPSGPVTGSTGLPS